MYGVEHLFMCLLVIFMSPLEKCLLRYFAHFFLLGCLFFWYGVEWAAWYILEINPLSVFPFSIIFSHFEDCLLTLFIVSFAVQKLLSLIRSHLFIFFVCLFVLFLFPLLCEVSHRASYCDLSYMVFCLYFPLTVLYFLVLYLGL